MPLVDVTEVLIDPDVGGQVFTVLRRQQIMNKYGEATWITKRIEGVIGSVQPTGDNALQREAQFDAQAGTVQIATIFRLRGVSKGTNKTIQYKPDIVVFMGNYYEVTVVNGWSDFGRGFIDAIATSIHNIDDPDQETKPYFGQLDFSRAANSGLAHGASGGI